VAFDDLFQKFRDIWMLDHWEEGQSEARLIPLHVFRCWCMSFGLSLSISHVSDSAYLFGEAP
jgi:hypothetical protein